MKHFLIATLAFLCCFVTLQAQISDEQARERFQKAEEFYEKGNNYECYTMCTDLINQLGKANPKILYLTLKAVYNNLEKKNDNSKRRFKKSYKNFSKLNGYADEFFSLIDKNTYPAEKHRDMMEVHEYIQAGLKTYAYQINRKPEDAIRFLNECASKFAMKSDPNNHVTPGGQCEVSFSLNGSQLIINAFGTYEHYRDRRSNQVGRERIIIDLSKVWLETMKTKYHTAKFWYQYFFLLEFGNLTIHEIGERHHREDNYFWKTDNAGPVIVGPTIFINGKSKYDFMSWYWDYKYSKKMSYDLDEFEKRIQSDGMFKTGTGLYIYNFFDQFYNDEFTAGKYRERILEAFEFLIDYFGGGTPVEYKPENEKSETKF